MRRDFRKAGKTLDDENMMGHDPGYKMIMEKTGISWWNMNPIYAAWWTGFFDIAMTSYNAYCCSVALARFVGFMGLRD